jgi:hypothetical protein
MTEYPEHAKLTAVRGESQAIGEFLEWAESRGWQLMEYRTDLTDFRVCGCTSMHDDGSALARCGTCKGEGSCEITGLEHWVAVPGTVNQKLAQFFEIDLTKIENEKRAMLDALRGL